MSAEALLLTLLLAGGLLLWALWQLHRLRATLAALSTALQRAEILGQEQATRLAALESLRDSQQLAEHAIATGTAVVKEMHKGIADIPFSVLEAIPATRSSAKLLRGLHDSISDGVYGALGNLNKAVGRELRKSVPLTDAPAPSVTDAIEQLPARPDELAPPAHGPEHGDDQAPPPGSPKSWG